MLKKGLDFIVPKFIQTLPFSKGKKQLNKVEVDKAQQYHVYKFMLESYCIPSTVIHSAWSNFAYQHYDDQPIWWSTLWWPTLYNGQLNDLTNKGYKQTISMMPSWCERASTLQKCFLLPCVHPGVNGPVWIDLCASWCEWACVHPGVNRPLHSRSASYSPVWVLG